MKTHINGNTIEQLMTNVVTLTQSQYDALPLEQKNHGTYIISDADSPAISADHISYGNSTVKDTLDGLISEKYTGGPLSVNGTYQIPTDVMNHKYVHITLRRYGYLCSQILPTDAIKGTLTTDGVIFPGFKYDDEIRAWKITISSSGLVTLTDIGTGLGEPGIDVRGLF